MNFDFNFGGLYELESFFYGFEGLFRTIMIVTIPLAILQFALMITALVNLLRKPPVPGNDKILWLLLILLLGIIGPILYFAIGSNQMDEKAAKFEDEREQEGRNQ